MKKKKRNEDIPSFIDIEAEEDSSLEFEMEDGSEDIDGVQEPEIVAKPRKNWDKFTEELANKYNTEDEEDSSEPSQTEEMTYTPQYMFMPDNKSPRLWIIRTVRNKEKDVAFKVLNNILQNEKDRLTSTTDFNYFANDICSVIVKPELFGYIYIESFSRQAVIDSLHNIRLVNRQRISPVPLTEMVDVLTLRGIADIKIDTLARIRKGKYRNDVCQVIEIISSEMVKIRIVPRLLNSPKLFDIADFDEKSVQVKNVDGRKVYIYKRETFIDGFLEKEIMASNLILSSDISFSESKIFEKKKKYCIGEQVRVKRGDYTNMQGIVRNIERNEVEVELNNEILRIEIDNVEKHYMEGDTISYKGRNAMIVQITDENVRFIYTDTFGEEGVSTIDDIEPQIFDKGFEIIKNPNLNRIKRDPYLNMQVEIKKGAYKGYIGVVKDVYKDNCRVLLDSNMKYINVDRSHLAMKDYTASTQRDPFGTYNQGTGYDQYNKTPSSYQTFGKTPSYKSDFTKTPMHRNDFGKTPSYMSDISKTPKHYNDYGKTPNYQSDFSKTPRHRNDFAKTPSYMSDFAKTPTHRTDYGKTPNYNQDWGTTPSYNQETGRTPNHYRDASRTPHYSNETGRTPNYKSNLTPSYRQDHSKTPHHENSLHNKTPNTSYEASQSTDWLRDNTINNVLVMVDGQERVLKEIRNDKFILDDRHEYKNIEYVTPEKYDKVCVMEGREKGMYGILIKIEKDHGVVRCDNNEVRTVMLNALSKLNTKSG